jgi:hypothetical protein
MAEPMQTRPGWGRTARYGAGAGVALALLYTLAFTCYATVRSTSALPATPDAGLLQTLLATWLSLAPPALGIAAILALPVAAIGALTALLLRVLVTALGSARTPGHGLALGATVCAALSLGALGLLLRSVGPSWSPVMAETLALWLLIPLLLYTVAGALAGREMARILGPAHRGQLGSPQASSGG